MGLELLRAAYPWPAEKPAVPPDPHGWCLPEHREMLAPFLGPETLLVVELGSWLGQSTRLILELAPHATVACVDHWRGDPTMNHEPDARRLLPVAYETFLVNQWDLRDRVVPVREDTLVGLGAIAKLACVPDLVFFDAEHTTDRLTVELSVARGLFPSAQLYGDDWGWTAVRTAVERFAAAAGLEVRAKGNAWALVPPTPEGG